MCTNYQLSFSSPVSLYKIQLVLCVWWWLHEFMALFIYFVQKQLTWSIMSYLLFLSFMYLFLTDHFLAVTNAYFGCLMSIYFCNCNFCFWQQVPMDCGCIFYITSKFRMCWRGVLTTSLLLFKIYGKLENYEWTSLNKEWTYTIFVIFIKF